MAVKNRAALVRHAEGPLFGNSEGRYNKGCPGCKKANAGINLSAVPLGKRIPLVARMVKELKEFGKIDKTGVTFCRTKRGRLAKRK